MLAFYLNLIDDSSDKRRFEEIYLEYRKQMFLVAMTVTHNETDAEDVVHDVFTRIAEKYMPIIQDIDSQQDLRNYLLRAAKNTALNLLKKKNRANVSANDLQWVKGDSVSDVDFIDEICAKAEYEQLVNALQLMDEPYREVLYYHFVMELSVSDVAKLLERKPLTVKKQLVRGKKILLQMMSAEQKDTEITCRVPITKEE